MDFKSLNRRELQSLCKLNKIPANITNVAMADALKSLQTVVGIEEMLNTSRSETAGSSIESPEKIEITSPKVPRTSIRTSKWKKVRTSETELMLATASRASRGLSRQLAGDGNEFTKTPSVSNARSKRPTTSTVKKETTVQRVYNTRRSARLTEKKCAEAGVTEKDISQPVKIASFLEEVSATSEISDGLDSSSLETSDESNTLFEITEDNVGEENVENCDEGTSKAKVADMCIEFEKLDVVIKDGSDHSSVIEEGDCCGENVDLEEINKVENEPETYDEKQEQADDIKPDSEGMSNSCDDGDSEANIMVIDEKVDPHEASDASFKEHDDSLLCDMVLSGENSKKVDCCESVDLEEKQKVEEKFVKNEVETSKENDEVDDIKQESEDISNPCENVNSEEIMMAVDENNDLLEVSNVSVKEHVAAKEHYDSLLCDKVLSEESSEEVDCCDENVDSKEKQKVEDTLILNEVEISDKKGDQVDNMKQVSEGNSNSCDDEDLEEKLTVVDDNNDPHEALNVSVKEHLVSEEYSVSLLCDMVLSCGNSEKVNFCGENVDLDNKQKVEEKYILNEVETSEEKGDQADTMKQDSEGIFNPCENKDSEKKLMVADEKNDSQEELDLSFKEQFAPEKHYDKLHSDGVLSDQNNEKVNCCDENVVLEEKQNFDDRFILNGVETSEDKSDQADIIKPYSEGISNPSKDKNLEEKLMVFDEKIDPHEALNVSAKESNVCLASNERANNVLYDEVLSETDGSDADSISFDTENPSYSSVPVSEMKKEVLESHGSVNSDNPSELSELENADNETTAEPVKIEPNISANTVDVNSNEEEPCKDFEAPEESQDQVTENQFSTNADDVIDRPTHLTPIKNETLNNSSPTKETSQVSDNNETDARRVQVDIVEDDKMINQEAKNEKPPISIRQLKKQLKALSLKSNLNTNKNDQVIEPRHVLQAVCDSHLATGQEI